MLVFSSQKLLALALISLNCLAFVTPSRSENLNPNPESKGKDLDFSDKGRPGGQTSGGSRGQCPRKPIDLTALIPYSNLGKTVQEHPTFWIYVPYTNQEVSHGEFSLQNEDRSDLYRAAFKLPNTPGFVRVTLPTSVPPLQKNQTYRWYFKLYCQSDTAESNGLSGPIFVQGWVERIEPPLGDNSYWTYAENKIWYDAIDQLANLRLKNSQDRQLANDWRILLRAKGVNLNFGESDVFIGNIQF